MVSVFFVGGVGGGDVVVGVIDVDGEYADGTDVVGCVVGDDGVDGAVISSVAVGVVDDVGVAYDVGDGDIDVGKYTHRQQGSGNAINTANNNTTTAYKNA